MSSGGYLNGLPGCGLVVGNNSILSGGAIVSAPAPQNLDADIILGSGGSVSVSTTFPEDLSEAYQNFVSAKQEVIYSGGTCIYAGSAQSLSGGYYNVTRSSLMTLNEVGGDVEYVGGSQYVNLNLNPTMGVWTETDIAGSGTVSLMRTRKPCTTCQDWNDLYAMEMILYHAIDSAAWRIMRTPATTWPAGVWKQYQGALYRWNAKAYSAQYVYDLQATEDTFTLKLGWINVTCTPQTAFATYATVLLESPTSDTDYSQYRLLYGGVPNASIDNALAFVANINTSQIYFPGRTISSNGAELITELDSAFTAANASMPVIISGCSVVPSMQDFNQPANQNNWLVGLACSNLIGDGYGAVGFQLGYAQKIDEDIEATATSKWTYNISGAWFNNFESGTSAVYTKTDSAVVNGLQEYQE